MPTPRPSDPLAGLDGARRAGWARAYAAEAKVAELTAELPLPSWSMRAAWDSSITVRPRDGQTLALSLKKDDWMDRDRTVLGDHLVTTLSVGRARHLARSLLAAVQYAEGHLPLPEPTRLVKEPTPEGEQ